MGRLQHILAAHGLPAQFSGMESSGSEPGESGAIGAGEGRLAGSEFSRHERRLEETLVRLQLATEAAEIGLWDLNPVTNEIYFSAEWKRQVGYDTHYRKNRYSAVLRIVVEKKIWKMRRHRNQGRGAGAVA